jgi:hypothetical protein
MIVYRMLGIQMAMDAGRVSVITNISLNCMNRI